MTMKNDVIKQIKEVNLFSISLVDQPKEGIKSQWQAGFIRIFPTNYDELPYEHKTDKAFFEKYWEGSPKNLSFKEFKTK